jgi:hypothetical protein
MTERAQIEQHRHASPRFSCVNDGAAHKGISQTMCPVGRVRDDIFGKGLG